MAEKNIETVTLIAPNGQTVSVASSKREERLRNGYTLPTAAKRTPAKAKAKAPESPAPEAEASEDQAADAQTADN